MPKIHPLASVDKGAEIAEGVVVGPYCVVEAETFIGPGCVLDPASMVRSGTTLGANNRLGVGAVLGGDPQDRKYNHERTFLKIGDENVIREYATIHRATGEGNSTTVGSHCYLMAYMHLGHNTAVGDWVTIANSCAIAGHVTIEELVNLGGLAAIHQFVRVGKAAMVGGFTKVTRDVPPFMLVDGVDEEVKDINAVGLRRLGVGSDARLALHKACKLLYKSQLGLTNALETVRREVVLTPEVEYLLAFEERRFKGKHGRGDQR